MEAAALRQWAMEQLSAEEPAHDLVLDLDGLEHLDASVLQVLLAMDAEQHRRGGALHLEHVSHRLEQWFGYAGAAELTGSSVAGASVAGARAPGERQDHA
jgi:anti-anti-sigma factor